MTDDAQAKKPATLTDQLRQEVKLPAWVALCFFCYAVSAGMVAGMVLDHEARDVPIMAGFAITCLLTPVAVKIARRMKHGKLTRDSAGVSPVIGVILMVAITVVLAAVVFKLVSEFSGGSEEAPRLTFSTEDEGTTWLLLNAPKGLDWSDFTVTGCTTVPTGAVEAGDQLEACTPPVTVVHKDSNTVAFRGDAS